MTIARLEVRTYNPSVLGTLLNELSHKQALDATTKPHLSYLQDYLRDIGVSVRLAFASSKSRKVAYHWR